MSENGTFEKVLVDEGRGRCCTHTELLIGPGDLVPRWGGVRPGPYCESWEEVLEMQAHTFILWARIPAAFSAPLRGVLNTLHIDANIECASRMCLFFLSPAD